MKATIEVNGITAVIEDWEWTSVDKTIANILNLMLDKLGPSGSDPAPNYHEAQRIASIIGAKVTDYELPDFVKGTVY